MAPDGPATGPPDPTGARGGVAAAWGAALAVAFAGVLRGSGVDVPVGSVVACTEALAVTGIDQREHVYWAGRATLVRRPEDVPAYDAAFAAFWERRPAELRLGAPAEPVRITLAVDDDLGGEPGPVPEAEPASPTLTVRYSPAEVLRHKDFATYSTGELAEARRLMADLRLGGALRRSRRRRPTRRGTRGRPDLRRTLRRVLRGGGEPTRPARTVAGERARRVVLLVDISGSMEPYARALVRFAHAAVVGRARVEAFTLGTRLTRLTRELSSRDPDAALAAAGAAATDWSGGTRLGEALGRFNDQWGIRGMARGAVVVILSDGWDRGEPERLAEQMQRLSRVAHRVVWVNPLKASAGYQPLARGMAAALPYVDDFVEGHSIDSLERLARVVAR